MAGQASRDEQSSWVRSAVARFEGPLTLYAARFLGDNERARDVVQEPFLRLCRQDRGEVSDRLAEWLFTVCRNRALDVLKKEKRMTRLSEERAQLRASPEPGPPDLV